MDQVQRRRYQRMEINGCDTFWILQENGQSLDHEELCMG
jgi:hypothetical protein